MAWTSDESVGDGFAERSFAFDAEASGSRIPGVYRTPTGGGAERLVLLGHGGTTDKHAPYIVDVARQLAARGIASMAIDGPGHGERATAGAAPGLDWLARVWEDGGGTNGVISDWGEALDFIEGEFGARSTGWWGLSMGTMMGLPVCASDARIRVALLGLMGVAGPNGDDLERLAPQLACPVQFLVQWDDEIVPRAAALELFGLLGSAKKTLHANPGPHIAVPAFEVTASVEYLDHHLG